MTLLPLVWMLTGTVADAPSIKLHLAGDSFVVSWPKREDERVRILETKPPPPTKKEYRLDETFVLWDDRGLTIRAGGHTTSTRLKAIPTSPRLRSHDAVLETVNQVRSSGLSLDASALSGSFRIDKMVYLVVRWESDDGHTWLEALVSVDLASKTPTAKALAVLPGISFSSGPVSENLVGGIDSLSILLHDGSKWGVWNYSLITGQGVFHELGDRVKYAAPVSAELAIFVEKTETGTFTAGTVDLVTGTRSDALESPSLWKVIEAKDPPVAEATREGGVDELADLVTGAVLDLPEGASVRRSEAGILVWVGGRHPSRAWLYDPASWKPLAWWRAVNARRNSSGGRASNSSFRIPACEFQATKIQNTAGFRVYGTGLTGAPASAQRGFPS